MIKLFSQPLKTVQKITRLKSFMGAADPHNYNNRIVIPQGLQKRVVRWYHHTLCHPGINRTEETISQHFYWKNMRDQITRDVSTCSVCQKTKRNSAKSMDYSRKKKLNINHGNVSASISLVLIKYEQRNVVTKYQN